MRIRVVNQIELDIDINILPIAHLSVCLFLHSVTAVLHRKLCRKSKLSHCLCYVMLKMAKKGIKVDMIYGCTYFLNDVSVNRWNSLMQRGNACDKVIQQSSGEAMMSTDELFYGLTGHLVLHGCNLE